MQIPPLSRDSLLAFTVALLLPASGAAQDAATDNNDVLLSACQRMAGLNAAAFRTITFEDNALTRRFRGSMPGGDDDVEVAGSWLNELRHYRTNYDEDEILSYRGRAVARSGGDWLARSDTLVSGGRMPYLFDPHVLFDTLVERADGLTVLHRERRELRDTEVLVLGMTLEGAAARDFVLTGSVPKSSGGPRIMMSGMGGGTPPEDDFTVDLALTVDPATLLVHRVRVRTYQESAFAGQIQISGPGGNVGTEEADQPVVSEHDEAGNRIYKHGLPVRNVGEGVTLIDFDVSFSDHDQPADVEIDDRARRLLRMKRS